VSLFCLFIFCLGICRHFFKKYYQALQIHKHGYWQGANVSTLHYFDPSLADALVHFFTEEKAQSIVDFGCGMGDYVRVLLANHFDCQGYDGNPDTKVLSQGFCDVLDLSEPVNLSKHYDWVVSLEVGEHLPPEHETVFMDNLHRHNIHGIVLSWAVIGQGGYGHFNEQNNDYIKQKMAQYGYINDLEAESILRNAASLEWFKNTIMVFRKI